MKVWCECVCMRCDQYPGPLTLDCGLVSMDPAPCERDQSGRCTHCHGTLHYGHLLHHLHPLTIMF